MNNNHAYVISEGWEPVSLYDGDENVEAAHVTYRRGGWELAVTLFDGAIIVDGQPVSRSDVAREL